MKRFFLVLFLLLLLFTVTVSSHPGRTDSNGGHWDRQEGTYHYHSGEYAGRNSSGSSSETAADIEPEVNIVEKETSEEESTEEETSEIENQQEESTEEENPEKEKTLLIIILSVVGAIILGVIIFIAKKSDIENAGCLIYLLPFIIVAIFNLTSCSNSESEEPEEPETYELSSHTKDTEENFYYLKCNECEISIENCDYVETDYDEHLCISCAFYEGYRKCRGCEIYFKSDTALDSTAYYCRSCSYDDNNAFGCCFCGVGPLDYDKLVKFMVGETPGYMCVYCCENYFSNVDTMTPCYYCIECGEIFSGNYYLHYIYDETICYNCILEKVFKKCSLCNKYYDEGENGICGFCLEKQLDE